MEEIWQTKICVNGIILWENSLLFLHRKFPPLNWCLPGGAAHFREDLLAALRREIFEETGISIDEAIPVATWQSSSLKEKFGTHTFAVTYLTRVKNEKVILSEEHDGHRWVEIQTLPQMQGETDFDCEEILQLIRRFEPLLLR